MSRVEVRVVEMVTVPEGKKFVERTSPMASFRARGGGAAEEEEVLAVGTTRSAPSSPAKARRGWVEEREKELRDLGNYIGYEAEGRSEFERTRREETKEESRAHSGSL